MQAVSRDFIAIFKRSMFELVNRPSMIGNSVSSLGGEVLEAKSFTSNTMTLNQRYCLQMVFTQDAFALKISLLVIYPRYYSSCSHANKFTALKSILLQLVP